MKKKLKVLLVFDSPYFTPRGYNFKDEFKDFDWDTERFVYEALMSCGYEVVMLGLYNDIKILLEEISEARPDVIFNLVEVFNQKSHLDKNLASVLEMLGIPYTGASPMSLFLCGNKAVSKKILSFHKIKVPQFYVFMRGKKVWLPRRLKLPLIVKPLSEEASRGISLASVVDSEESLVERVKFIHKSMKMEAIAEEYIDGREFYVSILGDKALRVFPLREMKFGQFPEDEPRIATYKAKWDYDYRKRWGIKNIFVSKLPNNLNSKINTVCKKAYRALNMDSYARFDIRVTNDEKVYIIEANANPSLDKDDELGQAVQRGGIAYESLVKKIVNLALKKRK
ncbi:MAG: ATP-grasp domain-containing protein [Candidatus Omnitrophica bacterium]|nr:ATP-grasp domain-containing protein [Candidatus Omnitrophota bacterium]MBD3268949.1 ATP-grasp domain-containing protein [Candidatus Omnitrophota bacterium]